MIRKLDPWVQPGQEDWLAALLAQPPIEGQPLPAASPNTPPLPGRSKPGLFGASKPSGPAWSEAIASALQSKVQDSQNQRPAYGTNDRIHDFFATYNGAPTRLEAMRAEQLQQRNREEGKVFGAAFADMASDTNPDTLDQNYAALQRQIAMRQGQGLDTAVFERMADSFRSNGLARGMAQSMPEGTPEAVRRAALANPAGASAHVFDQYGGNIFAGPNGQYLRGAKGGGDMQELQPQQLGPEWVHNEDGSVSPVPGGPQDPDFAYAQNYQGTRGRVDATPPDPVDPMGQGEVLGAVMLKAQREGIEALSLAELQMFTYATTRPEPASFGFPVMPGKGGTQTPAQQQPTQPGRPARPAQAPGSPARPQSQADFDKLPRGAKYIDPDDGQLYEKQ